jgi:hypothetical protein
MGKLPELAGREELLHYLYRLGIHCQTGMRQTGGFQQIATNPPVPASKWLSDRVLVCLAGQAHAGEPYDATNQNGKRRQDPS